MRKTIKWMLFRLFKDLCLTRKQAFFNKAILLFNKEINQLFYLSLEIIDLSLSLSLSLKIIDDWINSNFAVTNVKLTATFYDFEK